MGANRGRGASAGALGHNVLFGRVGRKVWYYLGARLQERVAYMDEGDARLTADEVRHIALLARVGMTDEEVERMRDTLSDILAQFEALREVDTGDLEPTAHSVNLLSVMRDDEAGDSLARDEALANAPNRQGDLVRVKAVLE